MRELTDSDLEQTVGGTLEVTEADGGDEWVYDPVTGTWIKLLRVGNSAPMVYGYPWKPPTSYGYPT